MNKHAIIGMSIATAAYNLYWTRDTRREEMACDFSDIAEEAQRNVNWAGITDCEITAKDVEQCLFGDVE